MRRVVEAVMSIPIRSISNAYFAALRYFPLSLLSWQDALRAVFSTA